MEGRDVVIKVIGVGGGGGNAVNNMIEHTNSTDVEFIAINTDIQALNNNKADKKILIGEKKGKGLGAGSKPEVGELAANSNIDEIKEYLKGADMIFIAAGLGGGTGTGAAPVIAKVAKEMGILTVAVVTKPFKFEGKKRMENALNGLKKLRESVDALIEISNDKVIDISKKNTTILEAFAKIDDVLRLGVIGVTDLITKPGLINLDFADIETTLKDAGRAVMGVGEFKKEHLEDINATLEATRLAISSPLLDTSINGAKRVVLNFASRENIGMLEITEAAQMVQEMVHPDANIIFGASIDENMEEGLVKVTVIATDFDDYKIMDNAVVNNAVKEENVYINNQNNNEFPNVFIPTFKGKFNLK